MRNFPKWMPKKKYKSAKSHPKKIKLSNLFPKELPLWHSQEDKDLSLEESTVKHNSWQKKGKYFKNFRISLAWFDPQRPKGLGACLLTCKKKKKRRRRRSCKSAKSHPKKIKISNLFLKELPLWHSQEDKDLSLEESTVKHNSWQKKGKYFKNFRISLAWFDPQRPKDLCAWTLFFFFFLKFTKKRDTWAGLKGLNWSKDQLGYPFLKWSADHNVMLTH